MKLERGVTAALITGASSGIGRAVALLLGSRGVCLSLVDLSLEQGQETLRAIQAQGGGGRAIFTQANVADPTQLARAFESHLSAFGRLDICLNNAGIGEKEWFLSDRSRDGQGAWRTVLDVNLTAVVDGTRLAIQAMQASRRGGLVINVASAAGLYPSANGPVYAASKGGVVLFTRSLAHLAKAGVRVNALCPEFVETGIVTQLSDRAAQSLGKVLQALGGFIPMQVILDGVMEMVEDDSLAGECLWVTNRKGHQWWPTEQEKQRYLVPGVDGAAPAALGRDRQTKQQQQQQAGAGGEPGTVGKLSLPLPSSYSRMVVQRLSTDFRGATAVVQAPLRLPLPPTAVLVRVHYAGVNASDVNYSAGRYFSSPEEAAKKLPFDAGFEAVGVVVACGEQVSDPSLQQGRSVAAMHYGSFADYVQLDAKQAIPLQGPPSLEAVALLTSGLTASIALEQAGRMGTKETVLVTAAAGGTGQFAVQLAKLAGNTVVATCGSDSKAGLLRTLGADTVINYNSSDVQAELRRLHPKGVNLVYESVGGDMFKKCLNAMAVGGRLIIIGMMSQYTTGEGGSWSSWGYPGLCEKLLWKSQTVVGFFLLHYMRHMKRHFGQLEELWRTGKLQVAVDPKAFVGLGSVADAVEHLQSGKSIGKVVVRLGGDGSASGPLRSSL